MHARPAVCRRTGGGQHLGSLSQDVGRWSLITNARGDRQRATRHLGGFSLSTSVPMQRTPALAPLSGWSYMLEHNGLDATRQEMAPRRGASVGGHSVATGWSARPWRHVPTPAFRRIAMASGTAPTRLVTLGLTLGLLVQSSRQRLVSDVRMGTAQASDVTGNLRASEVLTRRWLHATRTRPAGGLARVTLPQGDRSGRRRTATPAAPRQDERPPGGRLRDRAAST
jgi:hypothetical protein